VDEVRPMVAQIVLLGYPTYLHGFTTVVLAVERHSKHTHGIQSLFTL